MNLAAPLPRTKIDGRTRAARSVRDTKTALLSSLGRAPTPAESFVIKRIAMYQLKLAMIEAKAVPTAADTAAFVGLARIQSDLLAQLDLSRPKI